MSNKLVVSDYDFDAIKLNLKSFLQGQSQFQDYDFDGSSLSILLDILSYNTHYLAYLANMATNEIYLDSADIRNNIVSLAKMIGYTPSSPRAPKSSIDITINNGTGTSVTMNKGTVFTTSVNDVSYQYVTNSDGLMETCAAQMTPEEFEEKVETQFKKFKEDFLSNLDKKESEKND